MNEQLEQQARAFIARRATVSEFLTGLAATGWSKSDIDEAYARFKDDLQPDPVLNEEVPGDFVGGTNPDAVPDVADATPPVPPATPAAPAEPAPKTESVEQPPTAEQDTDPQPATSPEESASPQPEATPDNAAKPEVETTAETTPSDPSDSSQVETNVFASSAESSPRSSDITPPAAPEQPAESETIQPPEYKSEDSSPPPPAPTPAPPPPPPTPEPEPPRAPKTPSDYLRNGLIFSGIILAFTLQYSLLTYIASKLLEKQSAEIILLIFGNPTAGAFAMYAFLFVLLLLATPATLLLFHKAKQKNSYIMTAAAVGISLFLGFRLFDLLAKLVPKTELISSGFITYVIVILLAYLTFLIIFTVCKLLYDHLPRKLALQIGIAAALTLASFGTSYALGKAAASSIYREGAKSQVSEIDGDIYSPKEIPSGYNLSEISRREGTGYIISFTSGKSLVDGIEFQFGKKVEAYDYIVDCLSGEEQDYGMGIGTDCEVDRGSGNPLVTVTQDDYFYIFQKVGDEARLLRASSTISKEDALKAFKSVEKVDRAKFTKALEKGMVEASKAYKESAKKGGAIIDDTKNP